MIATKLHVRLQNPRDTGCCRQNPAIKQKHQDILRYLVLSRQGCWQFESSTVLRSEFG